MEPLDRDVEGERQQAQVLRTCLDFSLFVVGKKSDCYVQGIVERHKKEDIEVHKSLTTVLKQKKVALVE